jgi:hypothetical protein
MCLSHSQYGQRPSHTHIGFPREVCLKTPKHPPRNPAGAAPKRRGSGVRSLYTQGARAGSVPLTCLRSPYFPQLRSSFSSRIPVCQSGDAGAAPSRDSGIETSAERDLAQTQSTPADRTIFFHTAGVSLRSRVSKTPRVRGTALPRQRLSKSRSHSA